MAGGQWEQIILEVFANLNDPMVLGFHVFLRAITQHMQQSTHRFTDLWDHIGDARLQTPIAIFARKLCY